MSIADHAYIPEPALVTRCRACGARIFFATTREGRPIPVDVDPAADGNLALHAKGNGMPRATVVTALQRAGMKVDGLPVFATHLSTCPDADAFRRKHERRSRR